LWEPPVLIALKDLCRPGTVVFDVGGNFGGLTSAMSRLVGPKGLVCTFEASPRIIDHLQSNIVKQGHRNVTLYHRAVYDRSNQIVTVYDGDHLNDSLYAANSPNKVGHPVKTVALDDFCETAGLFPDVVKIDIEGAEFDALWGARKTIEKHRPHLILEESAKDRRCFDFLLDRGYVSIDLGTYNEISSATDYASGTLVKNLLYLHRDRVAETPYHLPIARSTIAPISFSNFSGNALNGFTSKEVFLKAGRYLFDADFAAEGRNNNMMCGVRIGDAPIFRYHGYSKLIAENYRDWVVDLPQDAHITIYFDFHDGTSDPTLAIKEIRITKLDNILTPMWARLVME